MSIPPILVITRGLPAAGKSTWAKSFVTGDPVARARVNRDDLRAMLFVKPDYSWQQEQLVTEAQRNTVRALLKAGRDVVIDDTNLRPKYVREWQRFAAANNADVEIIEFPVDVTEAIARDSQRDNPVGAEVIEQMAGTYLRRDPNAIGGYTFLPIPKGGHDTAAAADHYVAPDGAQVAVIVDIDGTLALHNGRDPYDLTRCSEDLPNRAVIEVVRATAADGVTIIYCSGREDSAAIDTSNWLTQHVGVPGPLYMRAAGDRRKDAVVKRELFDRHIRGHFDVLYVLDDRQQVVDMWRDELGLTVFQVARGDF